MVMKILCVGNSFAVDAATYVHQEAKHAGFDVDIYVLYIGGCPISLHWENIQNDKKDYELYINGNRTPECNISLKEGIMLKEWDYITFQQVSHKSGNPTSYFPELTLLLNKVREMSKATFVLHKTWSYAKTYSHWLYGSNPLDQNRMDRDIENAYQTVSEKTGIKYIIPVGNAIKEARIILGDNLNRDGFHLNEIGRTLASTIWTMFFLGNNINLEGFKPSGYSYDDVTGPIDDETFDILVNVARKVISKNFNHNL